MTKIEICEFQSPILARGAEFAIILDEAGCLYSWTRIGPGVPAEVYERRAIMWLLPTQTVAEAAEAWCRESIALFDALLALYERDTGEKRGSWTEPAEDLIREIQMGLDGIPQYWDAGDWLCMTGCEEIGRDLLEAGSLRALLEEMIREAVENDAWIERAHLEAEIRERLGEWLEEEDVNEETKQISAMLITNKITEEKS